MAEGQECWAGAVPRSTAARALLSPGMHGEVDAFGSLGALPGAAAISRWRLLHKDGLRVTV